MRALLLLISHGVCLAVGVAGGIYLLPILTEPPGPPAEVLEQVRAGAQFEGRFVRDLADSDALHWGEGTLFVNAQRIAFAGELAPGPDYRLYLSPEFVETEADFAAQKPRMQEVGHVNTFSGFMLQVPPTVDPSQFTTAIIWCEAFGQFITAARYR